MLNAVKRASAGEAAIKSRGALKMCRPKRNKLSVLKPWIFLLPTILAVGFWLIKPLFQTLAYTLYDWNMIPGTSPQYVGLENFITLFEAPDFFKAIGNTFYYILMMVPFSVILPLFIAALIQSLSKKQQRFYRVLIFLPMIMPPVATGTVFQWLLHQTNGLVNHILVSLGILENGINFFLNENWAKVMIAFIGGWKMIGFASLMFSAAIGNISSEYYEAGKLDGAGGLRRFRDITIPLLSPTMMLMLMMSILFASQWTFTYIDVLTQGGPYGTSTNIYYMIYKYAFGNSNVGASAAASLLFLVIFGILAVILQKISKKLAFYDN